MRRVEKWVAKQLAKTTNSLTQVQDFISANSQQSAL